MSSTIRAYDVVTLHRSAQFNPATLYAEDGLVPKAEDKAAKDLQSKRGFVHVPASWTPGGVLAKGGVRRDVTLQLAALRLLRAKDDREKTLTLQRYVLGLALTAFTFGPPGYLRQGCNLVPDPKKGRVLETVHADGRREASVVPGGGQSLTHALALEFAKLAANEFRVDHQSFKDPIPFDTERAKEDLSAEEAKPKKAKAKG